MDSQTKALLAARAAFDKQAERVVVMDLRALSSVADFFVICTADSPPQRDAIREHIERTLSRQGSPVWHIEGASSPTVRGRASLHQPQWVLMDCGDLVVHLLDQPTRDFYRLEELWADAPRIPHGNPD